MFIGDCMETAVAGSFMAWLQPCSADPVNRCVSSVDSCLLLSNSTLRHIFSWDLFQQALSSSEAQLRHDLAATVLHQPVTVTG